MDSKVLAQWPLMPTPALPDNAVHPTSRAQWRAWLLKNHARDDGVWLVGFKKETGKPRMDYGESVEEALCFGWIDSKPATLDTERSMLWFAPRKARAAWSKLNKDRVERLVAQGLMHASGLAKVQLAKKSGTWSALDEVEALVIPPDLQQALAQYGSATAHFDAFPRSVKRGILEWISTAKKPETRGKRVTETAKLAQDNIRANQWRG